MTNITECAGEILLNITPVPRETCDFGNVKYQIKVDVDPEYAHADFDDPISLQERGTPKEPILHLYPEDAENIGNALIRAAAIRRAACLKNQTKETKP